MEPFAGCRGPRLPVGLAPVVLGDGHSRAQLNLDVPEGVLEVLADREERVAQDAGLGERAPGVVPLVGPRCDDVGEALAAALAGLAEAQSPLMLGAQHGVVVPQQLELV